MKSFIVILVLTGLIATLSPAVAESWVTPVYAVSEVEFKEKADWHSVRDSKKIHRIKTRKEFEKLGGKKVPIDFTNRDLVIVQGYLGCASGTVEYKLDGKTVTFSVKITERCTHKTEILHTKPYVGYFAVSKDTVLVDKTKTKWSVGGPLRVKMMNVK